MLDKKEIDQIKRRVAGYLREGVIIKSEKKKFVNFFIKNADISLDSAKLLFKVSTDDKLKDHLGFPDFNGFLWVINSSYYSMFYLVRALLESEGITIKSDSSVHSITFDALIYFYYGKLQKELIEAFAEAKEEAAEILGKEKAKGLIEDYFYEKKKRAKFTYEIGAIAMMNKAQTSLIRAKKFREEIRKIVWS